MPVLRGLKLPSKDNSTAYILQSVATLQPTFCSLDHYIYIGPDMLNYFSHLPNLDYPAAH